MRALLFACAALLAWQGDAWRAARPRHARLPVTARRGSKSSAEAPRPEGEVSIRLGTREEISALTDLFVECFCPEMILAGADLGELERRLVALPLGLANNYFDLMARLEVSLGLQSRLVQDKAALRVGGDDASVILVASEAAGGRIVGAAELRLVPADGRLPGNFKRLGPAAAADLQPYICNVSVTEGARRRGIARALIEEGERVFFEELAYPSIFLHVERGNLAARTLYDAAGYEEVTGQSAFRRNWLQANVLGVPDLVYLVKCSAQDGAGGLPPDPGAA